MNGDLSDRCRSPNLTLARARLRAGVSRSALLGSRFPAAQSVQGDVDDVIDVGITRLVRQAASRRRPACVWCSSKAPRSLLACGVTSASCSRAAARLARWHPGHAPRWVSCSRQCASLIVGVCLMGHTPSFVCVSDRPGGAEVQRSAANITTPRLPPVFPWSATQLNTAHVLAERWIRRGDRTASLAESYEWCSAGAPADAASITRCG